MTLQKIEFMYDIPDGYRFVRYGNLTKGCEYINGYGYISTSESDQILKRLIVEKIPGQDSKKHRWHDLMIEFANDNTLRFEFKSAESDVWNDAPDNPSFFEGVEYRKKPTKNTKRSVRLYLNRDGKVKTCEKDHIPDLFLKWLGDWQEVEI